MLDFLPYVVSAPNLLKFIDQLLKVVEMNIV